MRVTRTNAGEEPEVYRGAVNVEWFVVLDDGHGAQWIERTRGDVDDFAEHLEASATQEVARLARIIPFIVHG